MAEVGQSLPYSPLPPHNLPGVLDGGDCGVEGVHTQGIQYHMDRTAQGSLSRVRAALKCSPSS